MLKKIITGCISESGPMSFKDFMSMALYHCEFGYYMSKEAEPFGREGDFFTASHLHPAFGAAIARQIEQMWSLMGKPTPFHIIEFAPGRALLALDILRYLADSEFFNAISYVIIEQNQWQWQRQRTMLMPCSEQEIIWAASVGELPPSCCQVSGCILSNELLDAFPVHLVQMEHGALMEVWVAAHGDNLTEILVEPSTDILEYVEEFNIDVLRGLTASSEAAIADEAVTQPAFFNPVIPAKAGIQSTYRTEINLAVKDWLRDCCAIVKEGFILTVDYGFPAWQYYQPARHCGTLLCYHRHKTSENPYENIGRQDITAHVNFSALAKWGLPLGFTPVGYTAQGTFLLSLGIDELIAQIPMDDDYQFEAAKIKRLLVPEGMGQSHKVMVQYKGYRTD
ncbi:MAG: SAM-dependent methyltransferase, partial [Nitrospirae bacterium]|nr:SAM-dependent methyltransferase [Nitrospirota bacterium]